MVNPQENKVPSRLRRFAGGVALLIASAGAGVGCDDGGEGAKSGEGGGLQGGAKLNEDKAKDKDNDKDGEGDKSAAQDKDAKDAKGAPAAEGEEPKTLPEKVVADAEAKAREEVGSEVIKDLFDPEDETIRKRTCEIVTAEMVSKHFDIPAGDLKTLKLIGCVHSWKNDTQTLEVQVMMPLVHKSVDKAKVWYANQTKSKTKEELDKEMDNVKGKLDDRPELDTTVKKKTAKGIAELGKMAMPAEGVTYEDVPGIADEARASSADGTLWIRMGNLTFSISAYKGPRKPRPALNPKNPQAMAEEAMKAQRKWVADSVDDRKAAALKIAPDVVKAFAERNG